MRKLLFAAVFALCACGGAASEPSDPSHAQAARADDAALQDAAGPLAKMLDEQRRTESKLMFIDVEPGSALAKEVGNVEAISNQAPTLSKLLGVLKGTGAKGATYYAILTDRYSGPGGSHRYHAYLLDAKFKRVGQGYRDYLEYATSWDWFSWD
jgi:hypothetical protein